MDKAKAIERINKLLAKAAGTWSAPEREAFERKAEAIMAQAGLIPADLVTSGIVCRTVQTGRFRAMGWYTDLWNNVAFHMGVVYTWTSGQGDGSCSWHTPVRVGLYGRPSDCERVEYVVRFLCDELDRAAVRFREGYREEHGVFAPRSAVNSYRVGFAAGVNSALAQIALEVAPDKANPFAVILANRDAKEAEAKAEMDRLGIEVASTGGTEYADRWAAAQGYRDGADVRLAKGVERAAEATGRLLE